MRISKSGRLNDDVFGEELKKKLTKEATSTEQISEKQLAEHRDDLNQEPPEASPEQYLSSDLSNRVDTEKDSDDSENGLIENRLRNQPKGAARQNQDLSGITQARLDKASEAPYPHRNPDAWERTGEKRPVNNLEEEMGESSDEKRAERQEKAEKKAQDQPERLVDKDIGKQKENKKAFNLKKSINSVKYAGFEGYLSYKGGSKVWSGKSAKAKKIDEKLIKLMSKENLSEEDMNEINSLKAEKTQLLGVETQKDDAQKS